MNTRKKFVREFSIVQEITGKTHPDDVSVTDPRFQETFLLFFDWNPRHEFEKTTVYVDAGFLDHNYLEEVLEWLWQDFDNAFKKKNFLLVIRIGYKIVKIKRLLNNRF